MEGWNLPPEAEEEEEEEKEAWLHLVAHPAYNLHT